MEISFAIESSPTFLRCTVSGKASITEAERLLREFVASKPAAAPPHLLIDLLGVEGQLDLTEQFALGQVSAHSFRGFSKVAVVQTNVGNRGFGALVASNRGLNIRIFDAETAAVEWLRSR